MSLFTHERLSMTQEESKSDPISQAIHAGNLSSLQALNLAHAIDWQLDRSRGKRDPGLKIPSTYLAEAITLGKLPELIYIAQQGSAQTARNRDFWQRSPLLWAIAYNQIPAFIVLIAMGYDLQEVHISQLDTLPEPLQANNELLTCVRVFYQQRVVSDAFDIGASPVSPIGVEFSAAIKLWSTLCFGSLTQFSARDLESMRERLQPLFKTIEPPLHSFFQLFLQGIIVRCQQSGDDYEDVEHYKQILQHAHFAKTGVKTFIEAFSAAHHARDQSASAALSAGNQRPA